jgi:hypothetical protein
MTTSRTSLGRRDLLRRLGVGAGAGLLGPFVTGLIGEARGQASARKCLVIHAMGNGFPVRRHRPTVRSETDFDLPASLAPLSPYKREVTIVTPLYHAHTRTLHGNDWATLTCVPAGGSASNEDSIRPNGVSLDRAVARIIGKDDAFPSLNLALPTRLSGGSVTCAHLSSDGADKAYPPEWNPITAFEKIFAQPAQATGVSAAELLARDKSVLDFVTGDVRALHGRLAGAEREKLDQMLESLRGLEQQLSQRQQRGGGCGDPKRPMGSFGADRAVTRERAEALVEIAAQAIACGMTRVVAISFQGRSGPDNPWPFVDVKNPHLASHDGDHAGMTRIEQFCFGRVAQLRDRLAAVRTGNGTLADDTLQMCVNSGGGEHHGGCDTHPIVLVGTARGALRAGRVLQPAAKSRSVADVYVAAATAVGAPMTTFGDPAHCKGPLPGLLA